MNPITPERVLVVGCVSVVMIFVMTMFPPVRTTFENPFGKRGEVLDKPITQISYSYEVITGAWGGVDTEGYKEEIAWDFLARQVALVLIAGGVVVWIGRFKNPIGSA